MANSDFWSNLPNWGPGLFNTGVGIYGLNKGNKEDEERLRRSQGPLYDQTIAAAGNSLNLAGGFDPQAQATQRFGQQQAILAPDYDAQEQALLRRLQATGQGGIGSFGAVAGVEGGPGVAPGGTAINPQLAAFYAAKNAAKGRDAFQSLGEGEAYLNNLLNRSGMLQNQAANQALAGRQQVAGIQPKTPQTMAILKGGLDFAKQSGLLGEAGKYLGDLFKNINFKPGSEVDSFYDFGNLDFPGFSPASTNDLRYYDFL